MRKNTLNVIIFMWAKDTRYWYKIYKKMKPPNNFIKKCKKK